MGFGGQRTFREEARASANLVVGTLLSNLEHDASNNSYIMQYGGYMAKNEKTSKTIGQIASKGLKDPGVLSKPEIRKLAGSALTQRPDKKK